MLENSIWVNNNHSFYYINIGIILTHLLLFLQRIGRFGNLVGPMVLAGVQLSSYSVPLCYCYAIKSRRRSIIRREKLYMKTKCAPRPGRTTCLTSFFRYLSKLYDFYWYNTTKYYYYKNNKNYKFNTAYNKRWTKQKKTKKKNES